MTRRFRSHLSALVCAFAALTAGCATEPVEAEVRAAFGSVAVVTADEPCEIDLAHPTAGWAPGMGMGFVRGVSAIVVWPVMALGSGGGGMSGDPGIAGVVIVAVLVVVPAAAAVVWLPFSVIGGAVTALPVDEAEAAEAVLVATARDCGTSARLAAMIADSARRRAGREFVAPESADTIVEVRLVSVGHGRSWNWWTFDRPFAIETEAEVRVIRRADGFVLWEATEEEGTSEPSRTKAVPGTAAPRTLTYREWAADGGAPLRAEVETQVASLAGKFAYWVFGPAAPAKSAPAPAAR